MSLLEDPGNKKGRSLKDWFWRNLPLVLMVLIVALTAGPSCWAIRTGNPECDKRCRAKGYPAGECLAPHKWKHRVCVCWPSEPAPAPHFLLERQD